MPLAILVTYYFASDLFARLSHRAPPDRKRQRARAKPSTQRMESSRSSMGRRAAA